MSTVAPPRPEPPADVAALIEEARRRARRRRLGYAIAALLIGAVGAALAFGGGNGPGGAAGARSDRSPLPAGTLRGHRTAVSAQAVAGRFVVGMSFSDARHGWLLDARDCWGPACSAEVEGTNDGGRHWTRLSSVPTCTKPAATCASVFAIRRISERIGVLLADDAFVTTDGGHHWTRASIAGPLEPALATVANRVYVSTYGHTGCPGPCNDRLARAAAGTSTFSAVGSFRSPEQGSGVGLAGAGDDVYAIGPGRVAGALRDAYSRLSISTDRGRTWTLHDDPCRRSRGAEFDAAQIVAAGRYLAVLCIPRETGSAADRSRRASIMLSADAGRSFSRVQPPLAGSALEVAVDGRGNLVLANGVTSGDGPYTYRVTVSYDSGHTWRTALTRRGIVASHQEARTPALAIFGASLRWTTEDRAFWRSDDAGASWQSATPP